MFAITMAESHAANYNCGGIGMNTNDIKFDDKGLIPVIVQDAENGQVLMLAYANKESIEKTIESKNAHFWSRSRDRLWKKGEESGNYQEIKDILLDCDKDTVLLLVNQKGVACHTGKRTCFFNSLDNEDRGAPSFGETRSAKTLDDIYEVIDDRRRNPREDSYVGKLFKKGIDEILKKVGEEAAETIIAAKSGEREELIYETTDLLFHTLICLAQFGITPEDIYNEFGRRFGKKKEEYRKTD